MIRLTGKHPFNTEGPLSAVFNAVSDFRCYRYIDNPQEDSIGLPDSCAPSYRSQSRFCPSCAPYNILRRLANPNPRSRCTAYCTLGTRSCATLHCSHISRDYLLCGKSAQRAKRCSQEPWIRLGKRWGKHQSMDWCVPGGHPRLRRRRQEKGETRHLRRC